MANNFLTVFQTKSKTSFLNYYLLLILSGIIIVTLIRILFINLQVWPINGDETQYWSWAQALDWGYYSKPPMIAWLIALSTSMLGDHSLGLRIVSPLCHAITTFVIFLCARDLYHEKIGFWSAMTYLLLPGVSFSGLMISTDPILILFWALAFYAFTDAIKINRLQSWVACGLALGCAILSKYTAIIFIISMFLYLFLSEKRYLLRRSGPYLSCAIALLFISPNILWNFHHHFATFNHVNDNASLYAFSFHPLKMLEFILSQAAIFGPILWVVFILMLYDWRRTFSDSRQKLLFAFILPLLILMGFEALFVRAHANWAAPIYVTATMATVAYLLRYIPISIDFEARRKMSESAGVYIEVEVHDRRERILQQRLKVNANGYRGSFWLKLALILHGILLLVFLNASTLIPISGIKLPMQTSIVNWHPVGQLIKQTQEHYAVKNLLVDDRMLLAQSMYFAHVPLEFVLKWNPQGTIKDHYDLFTRMQNHVGENFLFVSYRENPDDVLKRFTRFEKLPSINLQAIDGRNRKLYLFYLSYFQGY